MKMHSETSKNLTVCTHLIHFYPNTSVSLSIFHSITVEKTSMFPPLRLFYPTTTALLSPPTNLPQYSNAPYITTPIVSNLVASERTPYPSPVFVSPYHLSFQKSAFYCLSGLCSGWGVRSTATLGCING